MTVRQFSQSAYRGNETSRNTYAPNPNNSIVQSHSSSVSPEYLKIANYPQEDIVSQDSRLLSIISDSFIELNASQTELIGDARFVFNALISVRHTPQPAREIINFGDGFRGTPQVHDTKITTALNRTIQALDAWALDVSNDVLIDRTGWGTGSHPSFSIARDIIIRDTRISQR